VQFAVPAGCVKPAADPRVVDTRHIVVGSGHWQNGLPQISIFGKQ